MRASGVLLPVFSLPSPHGIGCFSKEAYEWVDFLKLAGQQYWQILPLGPTMFVPKGDACELDRLTLRNDSGTEKELDVFSYVEFCLWDAVDDSSNFQRNFSTGEVEVEGSAVYHKTEYRERRDHYAVFWANCPISSVFSAPHPLRRWALSLTTV